MPADVGMLRKCSLLCDGDGDHEEVIWRDAAIGLNGTLKKLRAGPIVAHHHNHHHNVCKYFHTPNTMLSVYEYTEIHLCAESYVLKAYFDETVLCQI